VIVVELDGPTLGRTRIALSPLADALCWLRLAAAGRRDGVFGDPGAAARSVLSHRDVALVAALLPAGGVGYTPDFLTPKPVGVGDALARQLHDVAATCDEALHEQILVHRFGGTTPTTSVRTALGDGTLAARAANGLAVYWREVVAEPWRKFHPVLQADVARRSVTAGRDGVGAMLASLDPKIGFSGTTLRVEVGSWAERHRFVDADLVVAPTLFGWPRVSSQLCQPDQAVLGYPASGIGTSTPPSRSASLAALLGETRSALLGDLGLPRSTHELSERHRLSAATISYHLGILHGSGLLTRTRDRHHVLYQRTRRGDLLVAP
jgi:DNA-binding transcriptional ArsR family regulator